MTTAQFEQLVRKDRYQVFLFTSPSTFPLFFARHPWLVVNRRGEISRWEIFWGAAQKQPHWHHLHRDFHPAAAGISVFFKGKRWFYRSRLEGMLEGDEHSTAARMADFIMRSPTLYPHCTNYSLYPGPNSNTYVSWVLSHFPESGLSLRWNSLGRTYKVPRAQ